MNTCKTMTSIVKCYELMYCSLLFTRGKKAESEDQKQEVVDQQARAEEGGGVLDGFSPFSFVVVV